MNVAIRLAREADCEALAALAAEFHAAHGDPTDHLTAAAIRRDGFGADPEFVVLLAESDDGLLGYAEILETLPTQLRELFDRASRRHLTLNVDHRGLEDLTRQVSSASVNISYALLVGALIVGSSVLLLAGAIGGRTSWITTLGITGFVSSVLIAGWRVLRLWLGPR